MGRSGMSARAAASSSGKAKPALAPPANPGDHTLLWQAIRAIEVKVSYILGVLALLVPLTIAVFVAVLLK